MNILKNYKFKIEGLDCAHCALEVEEALKEMDGIEDANVNFGQSTISYTTDTVKVEDVIKLVKQVEPEATIIVDDKQKKNTSKSNVSKNLTRLIIGVVLAILGLSRNYKK